MRWSIFALSVLAIPFMPSTAASQEGDVAPRILEYDEGPATIDVSGYPETMQKYYRVFESKCAMCHNLARAINCEFVLEDEWEQDVKEMMKLADTFISKREGRQIVEFLVYDSKTRKKELYERKVKSVAKPPGF